MNYLEDIIIKIAVENPVHGKKLKKNIGKQTQEYKNKANEFFGTYIDFAKKSDKDLDYGVACYLRMLADVNQEYIAFLETGEYTTKSFEDANRRVYNNPEVMEYYMHGLLMSQYLWVHHNDIYKFFVGNIIAYKNDVKRYLEIGAGHGMYISEATKLLSSDTVYDVVDISPTSLEISKSFIAKKDINYMLTDIYEYEPSEKYDFITMGEVLEHVEDPISLLKCVASLLKDDGTLFITAPANAPAIDHIYLFKNAQDIRDVITKAGLKVEIEHAEYVEDVSPEIAEQFKIALMYGAFLKKQ
tara:strand:- start:3 stop:902 length:900 start_codon:yes stop_codon:yes gene_type:complete